MPTLRKFIDKCNIDAAVLYDVPLSERTTLRIGGPADAIVMPRNAESLALLLKAARAEGIHCFTLGGGANILAADEGYRGLLVSTALVSAAPGQSASGAEPSGTGSLRVVEGGIEARAGMPVVNLVAAAKDAGLTGLEFAAGLPGSVGGAVYMNARCYDAEFADRLERVDFIDALGAPGSTAVERREWAYKKTPFMPGGRLEGAVVVAARLRVGPGAPSAISSRMKALEADRAAKGHFDFPSAGSTFKNDRAFGRPTGAILDELGFRGRRIGDAMVNPKHANIFVNAGRATARDMAALIALAIAEVKAAFGFKLEPEVVFLGLDGQPSPS